MSALPAQEAADAPGARPASVSRIAAVLVLATALLLPFWLKDFVVFQLTLALIYAIAILGLNLLTGLSGQFSLGHSAFYAIGAYTAAILMEQAGVPYGLTIPAAGLICFAFGVLFGLPALRLEGIYLALATFALAVAMPQILKSKPLEAWTGGVQGIVVMKPDAPFGWVLSADRWLYFMTLAIALALITLAVNLARSRTGRALMAIRDNPVAAASMGIDVSLYKALTFGVSAFVTGIAGALSAIVVAFVAPDSFTFVLSVALFVGLVVGGVGSIFGSLFGGLFVLFAPTVAEHLLGWGAALLNAAGHAALGNDTTLFSPSLAERLSKGLAGAVYGLILIAVVYAMPSGAAGFRRNLAARFGWR